MIRQLVLAAALLLLGVYPASAYPEAPAWIQEVIEDRAAAHGVYPGRLVGLAGCESGFDPHAIGAQGELGAFQLHPRGKLLEFYALGYTDPFDVWESADYTASAIARGQGYHWSCY